MLKRKKRVVMLLPTILLIASMLANIHLPVNALPTDAIHLHGPPLTPIHMHGPALTPIHMHSLLGIIDLDDPWGTPWHELYPEYCETWTFTSWEDNGNGYLDQSDQIDMTNEVSQQVHWFHVDRVTMTLGLWSEDYQEFIYVEYKGPYDPYIPPVCTLWHEVWPVYHGVFGPGVPYHIIDWVDNGSGYLDFCDYIMFEAWPGIWWHVDEYATDLILNEKLMDPLDIEWHELYPSYCNWHLTTSWEEPVDDLFPGRLSPGDQVEMLNYTTQETKWYYVDRVTFTLNVTIIGYPETFYLFEYKGFFEDMYDVKTDPINSSWHMVWPEYWEHGFYLEDWVDNCNGVLDACDEILLEGEWCHIEDLSIDVILNEKIADPTGIIWQELHPDCFVNDYETLAWEDNGDGLLNPCDNVTLALSPAGATDKYHIENMTLTLCLTIEDIAGLPPFTPGEQIYIEYLAALYYGWEWMYYPKTQPLYTDWEVVCPTDRFGYPLTIEYWDDNCNGVLSYNDRLELLSPDGGLWCFVEEVAVDVTVKKIAEEPPPSQWYKKPPYPDYAPSGMPDFDQKQDGWYPIWAPGWWSHCGPVSVANSLWWFDSKYESIYNPSPVPPPAISDNFGLITSYNPSVWDDHDPRNLQPLVLNLAFLMDTDGQRTGLWHDGTNHVDMEVGISQYLQQQGINPIGDCDGDGDVDEDDIDIAAAAFGSHPGEPDWNMAADIVIDNVVDMFDMAQVADHYGQVGMFYEKTVDYPDFYWIEDEIEACEDVVLQLEFWVEIDVGIWEPVEYPYDLPAGGHYVTCAGVNSTTLELLICDPWWDAAEAGWPGDVPAPHPSPHPTSVHNDTMFVSHDAYLTAFWPGAPPPPPPGIPMWELVGYLQQLGYPPNFRTFISAAVVTSPLAASDLAVTNITTSKTGCLPKETIGEGRVLEINVTVENQGPSIETSNVTVYANNTVVGAQPVTLNPAEVQTLTFTWDTTGCAKGNYWINATIAVVPGETDVADNVIDYGWTFLTFAGDVDGDRDVDIFDIVRMAGVYGIRRPDPRYDPNCDLDGDGDIDIFDIVAAAGNYGKRW